MLALAFEGLGAFAALSGALDGSVASARVSGKLGYAPAGEQTAAPRGKPVREQVYRLERAKWKRVERPPVEIEGLEPCLPLFGVPG